MATIIPFPQRMKILPAPSEERTQISDKTGGYRTRAFYEMRDRLISNLPKPGEDLRDALRRSLDLPDWQKPSE